MKGEYEALHSRDKADSKGKVCKHMVCAGAGKSIRIIDGCMILGITAFDYFYRNTFNIIDFC